MTFNYSYSIMLKISPIKGFICMKYSLMLKMPLMKKMIFKELLSQHLNYLINH